MTTATAAATSSSSSAASTLAAAGKSATTKTPAEQQDQFLKLLTTQLQNQDPLSPMDNAQLTSQIAQINTVSGIATLNTSVQSLSNQFLQMQTLQGAALVGKTVVVPGNQLDVANGTGEGGFELASAADSVKVDIVGASGKVLDTIDLGAQSSGQHGFSWPTGTADTSQKLTFKVTATTGSTALTTTALMRDTVGSVSSSGTSLQLQLAKSGTVDYSTVKALN